MTAQLSLSFARDTAQAFEDFHADNPRVYETLVRLAREWVTRTGRHRLGMKSLYERARWDIAIATSDPDFKINNSYTPYYARLIDEQESDLSGLFEFRRSQADGLYRRVAL
jgi:hypothetical protein